MQTFSIDKQIRFKNEVKEWLFTFLLGAILVFCLKFVFLGTNASVAVGLMVLLLLNLARSLTQFHVSQIQIDAGTGEIRFVLNSIMAGEKVKSHELRTSKSEIEVTSGLTKYFASPVILKIFLNPNEVFRISNRYGFSGDTLISVDKALKLTNITVLE